MTPFSSMINEPASPARRVKRRLAGTLTLVAIGVGFVVAAVAFGLRLGPRAHAPNTWASWRGPRADGTTDQAVVTEWSPTRNVLWKAPVPGTGHSSPVVCGERVFITTSDPIAIEQRILGYERLTGKPLWNTVAHRGGFMRSSPDNSHASSTPACDDRLVYAAFINAGALWLTAVDFNGAIAWQSNVGPFGSEHGYASSVALFDSLVIVQADNLRRSFVAGIDRVSGRTTWRTDRATGIKASYGSPVIGRVAGRTQLMVVGQGTVSSYDPSTGALIWSAEGPAPATVSSPTFIDDLVFASGGDPLNEILAVRADGRGDVTRSHVIWRSTRGVAYVPTPVVYRDKLIVVSDSGIVSCFSARTGDNLWQKRLRGRVMSSPIVAGGHIFVTSDEGRTFVFDAGSSFELIAENDMGSGGRASLAVHQGRIYLRTADELFAIGSPANSQ
jgi:outer membrane protein assembly factor BamB